MTVRDREWASLVERERRVEIERERRVERAREELGDEWGPDLDEWLRQVNGPMRTATREG